MVRELLLAEGRVSESGPLLFYAAVRLNPEELAARTSRAFLGVRMECAQCHDHPFDDKISQHDFWSLAAFFARISRPQGQDGNDVARAAGPRQCAGRRDDSRVDRGRAAAVARERRRLGGRPERPVAPARVGRLAHVAARISTSPRRRSTACGPICSAAGSSSRWTTCGPPMCPFARKCSTR